MLTFRAFYPCEDAETSHNYLKGHISVLEDYGITNITTNNTWWMKLRNMYGIVVEKEDGTVVGGIRIQIADKIHPLPVELAVGKMDNGIYKLVESYAREGVGELCALWNAKEIAGHGISLMLTRAGISLVNQINCKTLMGICAHYTIEMFNRVGFVVDKSLGDGGGFSYPKPEFVAWVLGILNAQDLSTAKEIDKNRMLDLRDNPIQQYDEEGPSGIKIPVSYNLILPLQQNLNK